MDYSDQCILAIVASAHATALWLRNSEDDAIPFCTEANPVNAPEAKKFSNGFIKSANFAKGKGFV
ncbi:hypothetical protein RhiirA5_445548 [Rhizophagus irregularis]|uniref:Uncharacterized protein n=1 Tax=Rhizophagus irregularis TaxID=588596 RepID=A0A2I1FR05_9GLOM|nr:hypothetical protein RhiirA5_445548 [Rhizophagus irregularis]PKC50733.1 hypothetical protein RhiirA1_485490 [Rhizophagus irregularis]PKY36820.1 hypothetical protein RhiirB3_460356 [Rhizophagus irregularis]